MKGTTKIKISVLAVFILFVMVITPNFVSGGAQQYDESDGIPPATDLIITANTSNYYDVDGYINLNWTGATNASVGIANYTIWISADNGNTYTMNGSNTSDMGFDFYGVTATNYTFKIQSVNSSNGDAVSGQNLTWANGSYWFQIDKSISTGLSINANSTANYDEGYITLNWTAPVTDTPVNSYTVWISTDKGTTYTQNGTNTSTTGFDFHLIEANYTFNVQWSDGSSFNGSNLTWANGSYWLQIDKTNPSVSSFTCTNTVLGQTVTCSCSGTDALSGVATATYTQTFVARAVGSQSTTCTVTDSVGNTATGTATYTITGSGGGGDVTPPQPSASKTWSTIEPDTTATMTINKEDIDLTGISIDVSTETTGSSLKIKLVSSEPQPSGNALDTEYGEHYQYIQITPTNLADDDIESATISIKVEKTWITSNNINKNMVYVYRYADGQWNQLGTSMTSEDDDYVYYDAITPGFSYFIIAGQEAGSVVCDNDGTCESGETTANCPNDCPAGITCTPGALQCSGGNVQQCNTAGNAWVVTDVCTNGCTSGECDEETPAPVDYTWIIILVVLVVAALVGWKYLSPKK
jgi:PGF-pre-PGF domain-containing protein